MISTSAHPSFDLASPDHAKFFAAAVQSEIPSISQEKIAVGGNFCRLEISTEGFRTLRQANVRLGNGIAIDGDYTTVYRNRFPRQTDHTFHVGDTVTFNYHYVTALRLAR